MKDLTSTHIHTKLSVYAEVTANVTKDLRWIVGPKTAEVANYLNVLYLPQWQRLRELP